MGAFKETYADALLVIKGVRDAQIRSVVSQLERYGKPVRVGNFWYWVVEIYNDKTIGCKMWFGEEKTDMDGFRAIPDMYRDLESFKDVSGLLDKIVAELAHQVISGDYSRLL